MTENQRKWIEALRSGKYKQIRGAMFNEDKSGFCCLGVATVVAEINLEYPLYTEVSNWLSFGHDERAIFIRLNDTEKLSFSEIADRAEEMFK